MDAMVTKALARYKQWVIGATQPHGPIFTKPGFTEHPERNYNLKNNVTKDFLQHESQTFGINLGWTDDGTDKTGKKVARWFFARNGGGDEPLRYGEIIALGNGEKPSFVQYEHRTVGINLGYSATPVYEWQVLGGKAGDPVNTGDSVALYNKKADECLLYVDRDAGGDIGWPSTKSWADQFGEFAWKEIKGKAMAVLLGAVA